ncbi:MAG: tetratricopeptide repeat protein [Saprospiraceae bacterium]|nr:tetratricopeptide repeat protein [Saprospiraceae bacterium]
MKTLLLHLCITLLTCLSLLGQQNQAFRGKVLYLNSGGQPAVGVQVSGKAPNEATANTVYTTAAGDFSLLFPWAKNGQRLEIQVGNDDAKGQVIEVVNLKEVELCRMPAKGTDVFEVIVCLKGMRERIAQRYYKIIHHSTEKELERLRKEVKQMILAKEQDYNLIGELTEKITKLQQRADSISIYREAYRLASINKDNANARMLKYLELLEKGESIKEALKVLDQEKAAQEIEEDVLSFEAAMEELRTKAKGSFLQANYQDAVACYRSMIKYSATLGIDPLTIAVYENELARALSFAGERREALAIQTRTIRVMEAREEVPGAIYAKSLNNLSFYLNENGRYEEALEYNLKALKILQAQSDSIDRDPLFSLLNFGRSLIGMGQFKEALPYFQQALLVAEAPRKSEQEEIAKIYSHLGLTYRELGDFEAASSYKEKAYAINKGIYGEHHPETATSLSDLQLIYYELGQYDTVVANLEKIIPVLEATIGTDHIDMVSSYNTLGLTYAALGQYKAADNYLAKAMKIQELALDSNHAELAVTYNNTGMLYQQSGQYSLATKWFEKTIASLEGANSTDNAFLGTAYNNLSAVYENLGLFNKALEMQILAIKRLSSTLGENHPNLAGAYSNLSILYVRTGKFNEALAFVEKAINIDSSYFGSTGLYLAFDYSAKAGALRRLERNEAALEFDLKATAIFQKHLGNTHPNYAKLQSNLGKSYAKTGDLEAAQKAFLLYAKENAESPKNFQNWLLYYAVKGDEMSALVNLEKALELGFNDFVWLKTCSSLKKLRKTAAFKTLLMDVKQ